jgi:hypothetical protein
MEEAEELDRAAAVEAVLAGAFTGLTLVVVVARRAVLEELLREHGEPDDRLHPLRLGGLGDLDRADVAIHCVADHVRDVVALLVQHVRKFTVKPVCCGPMMKQFGKPRLNIPCNVVTPLAHFSVRLTPSRPTIG